MLTIKITRDMDGEYKVHSPDGREGPAYYTDDKEDAEGTARAMYGQAIKIKHRRVETHPDGSK